MTVEHITDVQGSSHGIPDNTYNINPSHICYGGDKFVVCNYASDRFLCSDDGSIWYVSDNLPFEHNWSSICYGDGKFVAVAMESDKGAYSTDGIEWHEMNMPSDLHWNSICYGNGTFVAIAENARTAAYSYDGQNWYSDIMQQPRTWKSICYGGGKFVAIAYSSNKVEYSDNGITWTESEIASQAYRQWDSICYGDGKFVAVAYGSDKGAYSTDGIEWHEMNMPSDLHWDSICYGNGKFVAVSEGSAKAAYSEDGVTWHEMDMPSSIDGASICYGEDKFIVVSMDSYTGAYSNDGITWYKYAFTGTFNILIGDKFNITFPFIENEENIKVFVRDKEFNKISLELDVDYSVTLGDGTNGIYGVITMLKSFSEVSGIHIYREIPITQEVAFDSQTVFAGTTEDALDKLTMIAQDNQLKGRVLHVPVDDVVNSDDLELPLMIAGRGVVYRGEDGKFGIGPYGEVAKALRQDEVEEPDETFVLKQGDRAGKYITFNDKGSVELKSILKGGEHIVIGGDGTVDTAGMSDVAYSGDYDDLSNKIVAGTGVSIGEGNVISANIASQEEVGVVRAGDNVVIDEGKISVPLASQETAGVVKAGDNVVIDAGKVSVPVASGTTKGVVQIGEGLTVKDGVVSANGYIPGDGIHIDHDKKVISFMYADVSSWTNTNKTISSSLEFYSMCYGAGTFVLFSYNSTSTVYYSKDGINWKSTVIPCLDRSWRSVCYGVDKFVAVSYASNTVAYSTDGENWLCTSAYRALSFKSICYGDGKFVAVASSPDKAAAYSADGIEWHEMNMPALADWRSVCYGDGKFVAVAYGSAKGAYSTDGIEWHEMNMPVMRAWNSVCYGNGKFVAVAQASDKGAYSEDGVTWHEMDMPASGSWYSVCYGGGKFVAVCIDKIAYSGDGINWLEITYSSHILGDTIRICYGNGNFVAVFAFSPHNILISNEYPLDEKLAEIYTEFA